MIRIGGEPFGDIEKLGLSESDEGAAEQCTQSKSIACIRDRADDCNEILDLLPLEKSLARLGRNRDPALFELFLETPQLGTNRCEQRDVAKAAVPLLVTF